MKITQLSSIGDFKGIPGISVPTAGRGKDPEGIHGKDYGWV